MQTLNQVAANYKALWLVAEDEHAVLKMEVEKGVWVTLIRERLDSPFSHIIEPGGIAVVVDKEDQLRNPKK